MKPSLRVGFVVLLLAAIGFARSAEEQGPSEGSMASYPPYEAPPPMQFIPAGEFQMGDHLGTGFYDEIPVHAVRIDAFHLDAHEVTNEEYCRFLNHVLDEGSIMVTAQQIVVQNSSGLPYLNTHAYKNESRIHWDGDAFTCTAGKEAHPVIHVSWYGAAAYANWKSERKGVTPCYDLATWACDFGAGGFRLPTEAEWEYAARGKKFSPYHDYPWGNGFNGSRANCKASGDPFEVAEPETTPVGYYNGSQIPAGPDMANGHGLYDMAGNVFEWCHDWYDDTYYQQCHDQGVTDNPTGPDSGTYGSRVIRGGSWDGYEDNLRCAYRYYSSYQPGSRSSVIGFRLVREDSGLLESYPVEEARVEKP